MRKILIITFCLMLIAQSLVGKYSDCYYCRNPNKQIYLSVFNANIWGLTYFADEPIPSSEENYDIDSVRQSNIDVSIILDYLLFTKNIAVTVFKLSH